MPDGGMRKGKAAPQPDDRPRQMREAVPGTVEFREPDRPGVQRHATHRLPDLHPDACRLDKLHALGLLDATQYANAQALLALWHATGLGRRPSVLDTGRGGLPVPDDEETAEDVWRRRILRDGRLDVQCAVLLIQGHPLGSYTLDRARRGLDTLDWLAGLMDGQRWTWRDGA